MYVLRPVLRASTARPPARIIRGRRYPSTPRFRSFHAVRPLAQAANPLPPPGSTPIGEDGASKPDTEKAAAEEQPDNVVATEDPEVLAQKLQRSREASRRYSAALRRQQRAKKSQGLPPVHIPDWFLKRRVLRHDDLPEEARQRLPPAVLSVSVSHAESGEQATCSIPASRDVDAVQALSRLVRGLWGNRLDDQEKRKVEKYLDARTTLLEAVGPAEAAGESKEPTVDAKPGPAPSPPDTALSTLDHHFLSTLERMSAETKAMARADLSDAELAQFTKLAKRLQELRADPGLEGQQREETPKKQTTKIERVGRKREAARRQRLSTSNQISPLVRAEIRATMAACLSALPLAPGDTFPSAKTNLILHSPAAEHEKLVNDCVHEAAAELGTDLIVLRAQDLAQLVGDYLGEGPEPSPRSIRSLGYETYRMSAERHTIWDELPEAPEEDSDNPWFPFTDPTTRPFHIPIFSLAHALRTRRNPESEKTQGILQYNTTNNGANDDDGRAQSQSELQLEDMKITALLDALVDATETKLSRGIVSSDATVVPALRSEDSHSTKAPAFFDYSVDPDNEQLEINSALPASAGPGINMAVNLAQQTTPQSAKSKIIHVQDFKELNATRYGGRIMEKLEELIRKRRATGESIMLVGTTCSRELTPALTASAVRSLQGEGETSFYRTIVVETESADTLSRLDSALVASQHEPKTVPASIPERSKFRSINLFHIREMLRSLDSAAAASIADMEQGSELFRAWASIFPESHLTRVLTYDEVHRIALAALGLHLSGPTSGTVATNATPQLNWAHVALATGLLRASDAAKFAAFERAAEMTKKPQHILSSLEAKPSGAESEAKRQQIEKSRKRQRDLLRIGVTASKYEKRLMSGIADPDQIKTTFDQVHVPQDTIDSIRTITSLSLLRPDAFDYGILATEKISGALLYGPPGTGKTLLAKAVAKESGSTVLEVSGSQVMDKYVGEGEKNVAAVFSLARKLSPCIVFLDEADAIFSSRDAFQERTSHRDILNQFLKEWDGLNDMSVFVMVATNRPFDLDDAVIRRLPRRLLVDLPTQTERKEILRIHLRGEQLDESVDLEDLSKRTPFYSGSDLKNIAVSAALACVKEENEQAAQAATAATLEIDPPAAVEPNSITTDSKTYSSDVTPEATSSTQSPPDPSAKPKVMHLVRGQSYDFPEKRILHARHFDKALQEISASISEDMSSLNAIKKFDEQYGDRKGKKRKKDFGFGALAERNENAARVRVP